MIDSTIYPFRVATVAVLCMIFSGTPLVFAAGSVEHTDLNATQSIQSGTDTLLLASNSAEFEAPLPEVIWEEVALMPNAIPFTLSIEPLTFDTETEALPGMQSSVIASHKGKWLLLGGRMQGLHTFFPAPANNFPVKQANRALWVIDPADGSHWHLDLDGLPAKLADPLAATNQPAFFDQREGNLYVAGGYGWDSETDGMNTFGSLIKVPVEKTMSLVMSDLSKNEKLKQLEKLLIQSTDTRFAVTGGELRRTNGRFYLIFGQYFKGDYHAFGSGSDGRPLFVQKYTEEVRVFTLKPGSVDILSYGVLPPSSDPSRPYHRRDGVIVDDIDPKTAEPRVAAFGGVFQVGKTTGYGEPIYIYDNEGAPSAFVDSAVLQKFSQYQCPVVSVFDDTNSAVYHTFYGGLSEHYFHQTDQQSEVFNLVIDQNRADGVPFISDITTMVQHASGEYQQFILPDPLPQVDVPEVIQKNLLPPYQKFNTATLNNFGTSANFIINPELIANGKAYDNGVIKLSAVEEKTVVGHFYGGIAAFFPYALVPNTGTYASNTIFRISLEPTPAAAYNGDAGVRAVGNHHRK